MLISKKKLEALKILVFGKTLQYLLENFWIWKINPKKVLLLF